MAQWYLPSTFKVLGSIPGTTHKQNHEDSIRVNVLKKGSGNCMVQLGRGAQSGLYTDLYKSRLISCVEDLILVQLEFGSSQPQRRLNCREHCGRSQVPHFLLGRLWLDTAGVESGWSPL